MTSTGETEMTMPERITHDQVKAAFEALGLDFDSHTINYIEMNPAAIIVQTGHADDPRLHDVHSYQWWRDGARKYHGTYSDVAHYSALKD